MITDLLVHRVVGPIERTGDPRDELSSLPPAPKLRALFGRKALAGNIFSLNSILLSYPDIGHCCVDRLNPPEVFPAGCPWRGLRQRGQ